MLSLLEGQTREDGLGQGRLLTRAVMHIRILKVNWCMPQLALQWFGTAELGQGGQCSAHCDWSQCQALANRLVMACAAPTLGTLYLQGIRPLCNQCSPIISISVGITQTATDHQPNQPTVVLGCTFTDVSGHDLLSLMDPWPILTFVTF